MVVFLKKIIFTCYDCLTGNGPTGLLVTLFRSGISFYSFNSVNTKTALSLGTSHKSLDMNTSLLQS